MKLHLGCGCVYLRGYINVDAAPHVLACDPQAMDILKENQTTFDKYYKTDFNNRPNKVVADIQCSIEKLPFSDNTIEEIIMIHVLEHFQHYKVVELLKEIHRVLKPSGTFIIGVPDLKETAKRLSNAITPEEEDWYIRLIHGTQRNQYSHHYCGYTKRTLTELLFEHGFGNFQDLPNINFYPAIHIKAYKGG